MNELKIFTNKQFGSIRTLCNGGVLHFVASDVCRALDIKNSRDTIRRLDNDEKGVALIDTRGGKQSLNVVNEYGLYNLVLASRKPEAKAFKRWITHEVIPAIRQHGMYATAETVEAMLSDSDTAIKLLTTLKEERQARLEAEVQLEQVKTENAIQKQVIAEFKPIKEYVDTILASEDTLTITQIAADYGMSAKCLNKILNVQHIIRNVSGQWILFKKYMGKGYTKSETIIVKRKDGTDKTVMHTLWTQKGRLKIHDLLTSLGYKANMDKEQKPLAEGGAA